MFGMEDISEGAKNFIYTQDYSMKEIIDGVKIIEIKDFIGEDGDFCEILRFGKNGEPEYFPKFKIAQLNRSGLNPSTIKAWHLHFKQDEIWYIMPSNQLFVGLWDIRKHSKTPDFKMRVMLGGTARLLYIPKGVAHGSANFSDQKIETFYFINQQFNIKDPDEKRMPWDALGKDFWKPKRD